MLSENIRFSDKTVEIQLRRENIEKLYRKGLELIEGGKLYGFKVDLNNPKEVIACLFLIAEDYNRFHERW